MIAIAVLLSGCSALESDGGRILLLVIVPFLVIGVVIWRLLKKGQKRGAGEQGRGYPDFDERDGD